MKNVILTCWFNKKRDPQRRFHQPADFEKIKIMCESSNSCGIKVIVFHDCFEKKTIEKYSSSLLEFVRPRENILSSPLSTNDFRFLVYCDYLQEHFFDNVFLLDASDIIVKKNPFKFVEKNKIYTGRATRDRTDQIKWMLDKFHFLYVDYPYSTRLLLNAGIMGGAYDKILTILQAMKQEFLRPRCYNKNNNNMLVFNKIIYDLVDQESIVTGEPVCSVFGAYENDREDVWFIHK